MSHKVIMDVKSGSVESNIENSSNSADKKQDIAWPSSLYANYVLGVFTFTYIVAFIDRQIFVLLIEPIKRDMGMNDTQVSLVAGFSFTLSYILMGIPLAWLADRGNRSRLLSMGVAFWSVMTAFCGIAKTFGQLTLARVGVGFGEAVLHPCVFSMISDYFPPKRLGRAVGIYMSAIAIGSGLAMLVGGGVLELAIRFPNPVLPLIGEVRSWQFAFIFVSMLGIIAIGLMATVKEPTRRYSAHIQGPDQDGKDKASPLATLNYIIANWQVYASVLGGFAMLDLVKNAIVVWTPSLYIRTYGWDASSIGYTFGIILLIFGPLVAFSGGWLTDKLRQRGYLDAPIRVVMFACILITPLTLLMPLMPSPVISQLLLSALMVLTFAVMAVIPATLQLVTPNQFRAQVIALSILIGGIVGFGGGPLIVALVTNFIFGDDMALRYSLSIVTAVSAPLAALIFYSGLKSFRANMERLDQGI